jgi:hypothetical protein
MPEITEVDITDLKQDPDNLNLGTERGLALLEWSLGQFGIGRGVLIDKNGMLIAGNKTFQEAATLGFRSVLVVPTMGNELVAVQRLDLDLSDDPNGRAHGLALADNRVAEVDLAYDNVKLLQLLSKAPDVVHPMFSDNELLNRAAIATGPRQPEAGSGDIIITCPCCGCKLTLDGRKVEDGQKTI